MAEENEIRVVITGVASDLRRALEGAKGDLGGLKAAIKDVPNQVKVDVQAQTAAAVERLRVLRQVAKDVPNRINIEASADTGVADAKLRLLERQAHRTEEAIARAQLGGLISAGGGGGAGFGSTLLSNLGSGGLPGAGPLALGAAAAPFVAAGAGSITAVAGSAGAAALGAGALGTSALGVLGAGLTAIAAVAIPAASGVKNVTAAQAALEKAVADYGAKSKQAAQAQQNLNGVIADAGPLAAAISTQLGNLGDRWQEVSKPAQHALLEVIAPALKVISDLMPTVAGIAKQALEAIGKALDPVFKGLSSPAFKKVLTDLGDAFSKLAGPLIGAGANLMRAFLNVAVAAAPYLIQIAQAFERWTASFAHSLQPGQHLNDLIKGLVGQLHSWWDLATSIGRLMVTVFKGGADLGKGLVDQLTHLLDKWNAWLHTTAGQEALHKFFVESLDLLKAVAGVLGPLAAAIGSMAVGLIPTMTSLLKPLAELLNTISKWVNNLSKDLPPVLNALPGLAVAVGVLASWKALQAVVATTVAMMLRGIGLGGAGAAAGAGVTGAEVGGGVIATGALYTTLLPALAVALPAALVVALETGGPSKGKTQPGLASALGPLGATKTTGNVLDRLNPLGGSGFLGLGAAQTDTQSKAITGRLKAIADGLKGIASPAQLSTAQLGKLRDEIGKLLLQPDLTKTQRDGLIKLEKELETGQGPISAITKFGQIWAATFQGISAVTGNVFTQVKQTLHTDLQNISDNLGTGTKQGQQALVGSLSGALQTILDNTSATVRGTAKGIAAINAALGSSLKALGATQQAIDKLGPVVTAQVFTGFTLPTGPTPHAGGGLIQVGRPGERGSDRVPMNVGGVPIRVGAGEKVGVFNHQQQALAHRLIPGGLDGLFAATRGTRHDMAGGGIVGQPTLGYGQLEGLWTSAGGPPGVASAAAAIALAESGGRDVMQQGQPFATTGWGYWQITPGGPQYLDPRTNALAAVAKYRGAGNTFQPWTTYNDGAYRQFLKGGVPPATSAALAQLTAPAWTGPGGALGNLGKTGLAKVAAAANAFLARQLGAAGNAPAIAPGGASTGPPGLTTFEGVLMSKWIADELAWGVAHGWHGQPTSGYRPGVDPHTASGTSEHALIAYPGGAVDFGGYTDPAAYATKLALVQLAARLNYPGPRLQMPIGFHDDGHLSGTGHAAGGFVEGFAGGGRPAAQRAAKKPPHAPKHKHPKSTAAHAPFIPKDALKGLLTPSELVPDRHASGYARQATVFDEQFSNLLTAQAASPVDDPELVTLSDADVKALDPDGRLGYQAGDQIVNKDGMTVGRFFGPGGQILGGTFHAGASTRMAQLSDILANRTGRLTALRNEQGAQRAAVGVDEKQIKIREQRKKRIERYLHASVVRAGVVKAELDVLKARNLAKALRDALSKQAIAGRLGGLRSHLRTVSEELTAERASQAQLIPIMKDPAHTQELEAQAQSIKDSIAVESQLGQSGSATVQRARSAIYANDLRQQLAGLEKTNVSLGGKALEAGTGGAIGTILGQIKTLGDDRDSRQNTLADFGLTQIVPARAEIASYLKEQADIGTLANIQPRTPATAAGPDLAALNALLQTQLSQTQQALAVSQSQFAVFQGFAPLLAGRVLGSFQGGIANVPQTGPYLLHRDETIVPDPSGPAYNRAAATVHTAQGPIEITLNFQNNEPPLVRLVQAQMNQHALQIVSDRSGQRARLMAGVRRP